jgi:hypothetical protein
MSELYALSLPVQKSDNCRIDADNISKGFEIRLQCCNS